MAEGIKQSDRAIVRMAIANIHPDPVQPRLHPDAELADSIRSQGILQPFSVEPIQDVDAVCPDCGRPFGELVALGDQFMLNDGERRWRGAIAAGLKEVDVEIVPITTPGKRLLRQVTANTGKPLTAIEQALAYKAIMDEEDWTQAELARQLGIPKSVVGDRIRLIELDPVWLDLISSGKLQVSHAPLLSVYSPVPSEYQKKAAAVLMGDYRSKRFIDHGDQIPVDELPRLLRVAFRDFIRETSQTPGYRGPVVELKNEYGGGKTKYAADITIWRPLFRKYESKRRKEMQRNAGGSPRTQRDLTVDKLDQLPKRQSSTYHPEANKGEIIVYQTDQGWEREFLGDPNVFLAKVDPSKLTRVYAKYNSGIATTDLEAVKVARQALADKVRAQLEGQLSTIRGKLRASEMDHYRVSGLGCFALLRSVEEHRNPLPVLALAMGIPLDAKSIDDLDDVQAPALATAFIATRAGFLKVPDWRDARWTTFYKMMRSPFKLPEPAKSKKQEKREARAAGKQVGDPSRAPKLDVNAMRAAVEAGTLEEAAV